jgi:hypothetical protein
MVRIVADPPAELGTGVAGRVEALRRALLGVRARLRAVEDRERAGPLPPPAIARRRRLRIEAGRLRAELHRVIRDEVPADEDPG